MLGVTQIVFCAVLTLIGLSVRLPRGRKSGYPPSSQVEVKDQLKSLLVHLFKLAVPPWSFVLVTVDNRT